MELQFDKREESCLRPIIRETKQTELTQELRLSDGMPDAGRILGAWGQPMIRSKQWNGDQITVSGGVMTWVLYAPEDGSECRAAEVWVPFQMRWDIPTTEPDGVIRVSPVLRFVDGRTVSSRKFMVRMGLSVYLDALCPMNYEIPVPMEMPEDVHILQRRYPLRLVKNSGEKIFTMDEEFMLSEQQMPIKLLRYTVRPEITEKKMMGDKVIFRGNLNLNLLYRNSEGEIQNWEGDMPFSQYDQMEEAVSGESTVDIQMVVTGLELDVQDQRLHLKCDLAAQYLVEEEMILEFAEDAYCTNRDVKLQEDSITMPVILERRVDAVSAEQMLSGKNGKVLDVTFTADFPKISQDGEQCTTGVFSVIYCSEDGIIQNSSVRWETKHKLPMGERCKAVGSVIAQGKIRVVDTAEGISLSVPLQIQTQTGVEQELKMIAGMELGPIREPDPNRPSLILCRPGRENLWSLAKRCGSTVGAIQRANNIDEEFQENRLLLIPIS